MKMLIICRGSIEEGLGHLYRAKSFANTARNHFQVNILTIIENGLEYIFEDALCNVEFLSKTREKEAIKYINDYNPEIIVFDMKNIDSDVFNIIEDCSAIKASISPIFEFMEKMDIMFSRSLKKPKYQNVKVYNGLKYALLGENCNKIPSSIYKKNLNSDILSVSISMGGSDASNKTYKILNEILNLTIRLIIWVILGEGYKHSYDELISLSKNNIKHEIILVRSNKSMWKILNNTVLGIFTGGLTTIEGIYAGLPSINIFSAKQNDSITRSLIEKKLCLDGGEIENGGLDLLNDKIKYLNNNRSELLKIRNRTQQYNEINNANENVIRKIKKYII